MATMWREPNGAGHRCRGPGSFPTPVPSDRATFDAERLEAQPRRRLLLASLVDEPDAADLAPALDSARHVVARELALDALLQPIRLSGIKALADERTQVVAQLLCQLGLGHPA